MVDSFASPKFPKDLFFLMFQFFGKQKQHRLSYHLLCRISEYLSCGAVPACDDTIQVFADDGIVTGFDDRGEKIWQVLAGYFRQRNILIVFFQLYPVGALCRRFDPADRVMTDFNCDLEQYMGRCASNESGLLTSVPFSQIIRTTRVSSRPDHRLLLSLYPVVPPLISARIAAPVELRITALR